MYYLFSFYYLTTFNVIRQYLAISLIAISLIFIYKNKFILSVITILIAFSFHESVIILVPLLFFIKRNFTYKQYFVIVILFIGITFLIDNLIIYTKYSYFLNYEGRGINNFIYVFLFINIIILYNKNKLLCVNKRKSVIFVNLAFYSILIIIPIFYIKSVSQVIFFRINYYFFITYLILVGDFKSLLKGKKSKMLFSVCVLFFLIFYFTRTVILNGEAYNLIPYKFNFNLFQKY